MTRIAIQTRNNVLSAVLLSLFMSIFLYPASAQAELLRARNANLRERQRYEESADGVRRALRWTGYRQWEWQESECHDCEIRFVTDHPDLLKSRPQEFIHALESRKQEIRELYGVSDQEYTFLAHMAIGILGRESEFFSSPRYHLKESMPGVVRILKYFLRGSTAPNSRGPTQIKIVPEKIAEKYGIVPETLHDPENAALATMGFLSESLRELKTRIRVNDLDFINESNYVDYLPYLYFGGTRRILNGSATPDKNIYVNDMKRYMSYVEIYERPRKVQLQPL